MITQYMTTSGLYIVCVISLTVATLFLFYIHIFICIWPNQKDLSIKQRTTVTITIHVTQGEKACGFIQHHNACVYMLIF